MKINRGEILNLPNYISIVRVVLIPAMMIFMMMIRPVDSIHHIWNVWISFIAALVYGVASFSDIVDGYLARRWNTVSTFGKFLDPLADKLLNLTAIIMLIPLGRIPAWLVVIILTREISVTALRGIAANEQIVISASKWGKMKNAFGSFGVAFLILYYSSFGVNWMQVGWALLIISVVFSVGSGVHYTYNFFAEMKRRNENTPR